MTVLEFPPEALAVEKDAEAALANAKAYTISTADDYKNAGAELILLSGKAKKLELMRKDLKAPALEQCRRIDNFFRPPQQFIEDAKGAIKGALGQFDAEQQKIRQEVEREAARAVRIERERLGRQAAKVEEAARKTRAAEEVKAKNLEEAGRSFEAHAKRKAAEEKEAARMRDVAAKLFAAEILPIAPVIHQEPPKVDGISKRKNWTFEIIDEAQIPREYLMANEKSIRGVVKALQGHTNIPGVRVYAETTITARSA